MKLEWNELEKVFPDMPIWEATTDSFSFVITKDEDGFTASVKPIINAPFDKQRHDLGGYCAHETLEKAQAACEQFLRLRI